MLFSSIEFVFIFLPIVLGVFQYLVGQRQIDSAKLWLIAASLVFYGNFIPVHVVLLSASTIVNFCLGRWLQRRPSRIVLAAGVVFNVSILATFKYADFFVHNLNYLLNTDFPTLGLALPLGLSFFTFQKLAYLIDVFRGGAPRYTFRDFLLFVVFFPQLIAGPIVHHREMMSQISDLGGRRNVALDLSVGAAAFAIGLFKKLAIADSISSYSDIIFDSVSQGTKPDLLMAWIGVIAFSLQIYFDFSAYSDMALGLGRMFGLRLPINFLSPYKAVNIIEFWRRWHITLSRFLRDYLYIPLGGSRYGLLRRFSNLWIVMLLGGLWHGANWTFVAWGALHALYLSINHGFRSLDIFARSPKRIGRIAAWAITMVAVLVAWAFFRAPNFDTAFAMVAGMAGLGGIALPSAASSLAAAFPSLVSLLGITFGGAGYLVTVSPVNLLWFPFAIVVCLALPNTAEWLARWDLAIDRPTVSLSPRAYFSWHPSFGWGAVLGLMMAFALVAQHSSVPFLYFQF